jgi:hypothetical protein
MHSANIRERGRNSDPLLQVPPARRGNRVGAPFAVSLAKRGENLHAHSVPLAKRGEPKGADKGTSVGYKKSAAWGKFHPL